MGVGASFAGGIPFVSVDHNGLSCSHLTANHHGETLQLDLRGKGERSKGRHGLEKEKRARERGELIYL